MPSAPGLSIYRDAYILNTEPSNETFGVSSGTSFSAPVVTGIVARMLAIRPDLDAVEVRNILINSATSDEITGQVPNLAWGFGKLAHSVGDAGPPVSGALRIDADEIPKAYLTSLSNSF
jgi:subtilisin family serine protease